MTSPIGQFVDSTIGRTSTNPFITIIQNRAPTGNDGINNKLQVTQRWIDTSDDNQEYFLLNFISSQGVVQANWVNLSAVGGLETLTGNTGGPVVPTGFNINVIGTGGITTSGSGDTLTISGSGVGTIWVNVTTSTQLMAPSTGYIIDNGATLVTLTLPATAAIGDTYIIQGQSSGGWKVDVGTGQTLHIGIVPTTTSTGSAASTNQWDSITIRCTTANTTFSMGNSVGNFLIT